MTGRSHIIAFALCAVLTACASQRARDLTATPGKAVDFSGDWELNYQLSDRIHENLDLLRLMAISDLRRQRGRMDQRWPVLPSFELIELAESASRTTVLEIEQDDQGILLQRGDDFPLTCRFGPGAAEISEDPLGSEVCGWDHHQLVFSFQLPERLNVVQRLTLAPDGQKLNIATTVRTWGSGQTFTLNRVYTRYQPLAEEYDCEYLIGVGKACWAVGPKKDASPQ